MTFIGMLLALLLERAIGHWPGVGESRVLPRLFTATQRTARLHSYWRSAAAPLLVVGVATLVIAAAAHAIDDRVARLVFDSLVLFLCLGPRDLADDLQRLLDARAKNDEATEQRLVQALLLGPDRRASRRSLIGAMFVQSHERLFAVLIWFFVFGPAGAVAYRVASRLPRFIHDAQPGSPAEAMAANLHAALAFAPAHATAFLYGLAGSFEQALAGWRQVRTLGALDWRARVWATLAEAASASLNEQEGKDGPSVPATLDACLREVVSLQRTALLILLAFFAMFTAGGLIT